MKPPDDSLQQLQDKLPLHQKKNLLHAMQDRAQEPAEPAPPPSVAARAEKTAARVFQPLVYAALYVPLALAGAGVVFTAHRYFRLGTDLATAAAPESAVRDVWAILPLVGLLLLGAVFLPWGLGAQLSRRARWWAFGLNLAVILVPLVLPFVMYFAFQLGRSSGYAALDFGRIATACGTLGTEVRDLEPSDSAYPAGFLTDLPIKHLHIEPAVVWVTFEQDWAEAQGLLVYRAPPDPLPTAESLHLQRLELLSEHPLICRFAGTRPTSPATAPASVRVLPVP